MQAGYVREAGRTESRGGRRARLLEFNGKFGYVAGIDVGGHQVSAAVADLSGEVVSFERRPLGERVGGERILEGAWEILCRELEEWGIGVGDLMAVGVSTPGIVDPESGSVTCVPNIPGWSELRPAERFGELTGKTVVVENNVNAAMEGEHWRGAARGVST